MVGRTPCQHTRRSSGLLIAGRSSPVPSCAFSGQGPVGVLPKLLKVETRRFVVFPEPPAPFLSLPGERGRWTLF